MNMFIYPAEELSNDITEIISVGFYARSVNSSDYRNISVLIYETPDQALNFTTGVPPAPMTPNILPPGTGGLVNYNQSVAA